MLLLLLVVATGSSLQAQVKIDSSYSNAWYAERRELFESLPGQKKAIVFLGNSITERGQWAELLPRQALQNRGIGGDNTFGVLARLQATISAKPKKIFLLIGINDIGRGHPVGIIAANYQRIVDSIKRGSPTTRLYAQSVLPLNEKLLKAAYLLGKKDSILLLNIAIAAIAAKAGITFINLHPLFADAGGNLKEEWTTDGIHLRPRAYVRWVAWLQQKRYL